MTDPRDEELFKGPSLNADGNLENRINRVEPAAAPPDQPLELQARAPKVIQERVERYRDDLRARNRNTAARKAFAFALLLGVGALGAFLYFKPNLHRAIPEGVREATVVDSLLHAGDAPPVIISSEPPGATITVAGKVVGQTPWAGENRWPGEQKVVLQLKGYRVWEGKLNGGKAQTLDVELKQ